MDPRKRRRTVRQGAERKHALKQLIEGQAPQLIYSDHVQGQGAEFLENACKLQLSSRRGRSRPHSSGPVRAQPRSSARRCRHRL
jgi:hypothetical protein